MKNLNEMGVQELELSAQKDTEGGFILIATWFVVGNFWAASALAENAY